VSGSPRGLVPAVSRSRSASAAVRRLRHRLVDAGPRIRHLARRGPQRQRLGCAGGFETDGQLLEIGEEHRGSVDLVARRGGREGPSPVCQLVEPRDEGRGVRLAGGHRSSNRVERGRQRSQLRGELRSDLGLDLVQDALGNLGALFLELLVPVDDEAGAPGSPQRGDDGSGALGGVDPGAVGAREHQAPLRPLGLRHRLADRVHHPLGGGVVERHPAGDDPRLRDQQAHHRRDHEEPHTEDAQRVIEGVPPEAVEHEGHDGNSKGMGR
jgi:hypothetical protein